MAKHSWGILLIVACLMAWSAQGAALGELELDGDATNDPGSPADDWDLLYGGIGHESVWTGIVPSAPTAGGIATRFVLGCRDSYDFPSLGWDSNSVPSKDDITNAYGAVYAPGDVFFGVDRYGNNGDAYVGFWFLKEAIDRNLDGTFDGTHTVGDVLVLSDVPVGGGVRPVRVYRWAGAGVLDSVHVGSGQGFATANQFDAASPWSYTPKTGTAGTFPPGSFFEGGVDLGSLGLWAGFKSLLVETRSSQSLTAELKDFVLVPIPTGPLSNVDPASAGYGLLEAGCSPNPFSSATSVSLSLPKPGPVSARIYDVQGRLTKVLLDEASGQDHYSACWNGDDLDGRTAGAGIYFLKVTAGGCVTTVKLMRLR
jgi:hypothetical protein